MGGSQLGKSKLIEWIIRQRIIERQGLTLVDWHGKTFHSILRWCARFRLQDDIVPVDLSDPSFVCGFNPFKSDGSDLKVQTDRVISTVAKVHGQESMHDLPKFRRVCGLLVSYCVETSTPPHAAVHLLDLPNKALRQRAIREVNSLRHKAEWQHLNALTNAREWEWLTGSTKNRLADLVCSPAYRFLNGSAAIGELMDRGAVVLVNLGQSTSASPQSARDFGSLLLSEYLNGALLRGYGKRQHYLYLDEAQAYLTLDAAAMLDQVLKFGLHICPIFHHLQQFESQHLRTSILEQCRVRFIFGGLDYLDAAHMAQVLFLPSINRLAVKASRRSFLTQWEERERVSVTERDDGASTTKSRGHVPVQEEQDVDVYYNRDEKISLFAEAIRFLPPRHCMFQPDSRCGIEIEIPFVPEYEVLPEKLEGYKINLYRRADAVSRLDLDRRLAEEERRFLKLKNDHDDNDYTGNKKRA